MITAPMEMIPTAGVRMIEIMIVTGTMTAAMDLTVIEIMDMMNASELLHAPTVMLERMIVVPDLLPMRRLILVVVDPKLPVFVPNLTREIDLVGHYRFVAPGDHLGASKFASEI